MSEYIKKLRIIDENGDPQDKQIDYNALANLPTSLPANGGTATKAFEDGQGRDIVKTYATLADLPTTLPSNGGHADSAERAEKDNSGNIITTTYATKRELENINLSKYATKEDVSNSIANLVDSAPEALDTLGELANAIHQHEDAYDGLLEVIGNKVDKNEIDNIPTENSEHLVTSGGVYEAIKNVKEEIIDAIILKASNSSQLFKITIDNNGTLRATKI